MSKNRQTEFPLVSCIMPTFNRRLFVPQAIKYFLEQDYPAKELIIVDDGTDVIEDLIPNNLQISYIRLQRKISIGAKRNLAIEKSHGEIILHWDDDDWQARHRIRYQVEQLVKNSAEICGTNKLLFYDLRSKTLWLYEFPINRRMWFAGAALCYTRSFWPGRKFTNTNIGEDTRFVWGNLGNHAFCLPAYHFYVAIIHQNNVCSKSLSGSCWKKYTLMDISEIMHEDWSFYKKLI